MTETTIQINGIEYIRKDSVKQQPEIKGDIVMVRSTNAGVFFGTLIRKDLENGVVEMANARRVWYWDGACSLSQLATDGTSKPSGCKFPVATATATILGVIEIIPMTDKAIKSLEGVKVWEQ